MGLLLCSTINALLLGALLNSFHGRSLRVRSEPVSRPAPRARCPLGSIMQGSCTCLPLLVVSSPCSAFTASSTLVGNHKSQCPRRSRVETCQAGYKAWLHM